jgi:hypothetical protein
LSSISKFFIDRPIFAAVISLVIVLAGRNRRHRVLPVAEYRNRSANDFRLVHLPWPQFGGCGRDGAL